MMVRLEIDPDTGLKRPWCDVHGWVGAARNTRLAGDRVIAFVDLERHLEAHRA